MASHKKLSYWRIIEPIILGCLANFLINFIFNPQNPDVSLEEYIVAILFSALITELNHFIDGKLENKYKWSEANNRRFFYNLLYLVLSLIFILNVIGNIYMWLVHKSFYQSDEMLTINLITFLMALLLTIFKWTAQFYRSWKHAELNLKISNSKFNELSSQIDQEDQLIDLRLKNRNYKIKSSDIKLAKSEFGITKVFISNAEFYIFQGTLSNLFKVLPDKLFFQVSRDIILNKKSIESMASSTFGKISLTTKLPNTQELTVSRPKAASFRIWYNSNSV